MESEPAPPGAAGALTGAGRCGPDDCYKVEDVPVEHVKGPKLPCTCGLYFLGQPVQIHTVPCWYWIDIYPAHQVCIDEKWSATDCEEGDALPVKHKVFKCSCACEGPSTSIGGIRICLGRVKAECRVKKKGQLGTVQDANVVSCER